MKTVVVCLLISISLVASHGLSVADDSLSPPSDFKLVASYGAGHSTWKSWNTTITGDGKANLEVHDGRGGDKLSKLTEGEIRAILAKIDEVKFVDLKGRYESEVTDLPTLTLTVTANQKTHEVVVYGPSQFRKDDEVKRFLKLWSEVLRDVPSPNSEQKPDSDGL